MPSAINKSLEPLQLGVLGNAFLVVVKTVSGVIGNSYALIADGIESTADTLSSLISQQSYRVAQREASTEYHFGYGKAESIATAAVSLLLLGAACGVAISSIRGIADPGEPPAFFTIPVMIIVLIIKQSLYLSFKRASHETVSTAIHAEMWHHRSDMISTFVALIGVSLAVFGGPTFRTADETAALIGSMIMAVNGSLMMKLALHDLMDKAPDDEILKKISDAAYSIAEVRLTEKILARKAGSEFIIALHVHADPQITLHAAHEISGKVKSAIKQRLPEAKTVLIHMEPSE